MNENKIKRLQKLLETANEDFATTEEVAKLFAEIIKSYKSLDKSVSDKISQMESNLISRCSKEEIDGQLRNILSAIEQVRKMEGKPGNDAVVDYDYIREMIPEYIPDPIPGDDGSPDTGEHIIFKINDAEGEERIRADKIEGFDTFITKKNLDRAIDILDKRTQYLINKTVGSGIVSHDSTLSGNGTPSSPLSVIGGGGGVIAFSTIVSPVIDSSNKTYTASVSPSGSTFLGLVDSYDEVVMTYYEGISYTRSGSIITMVNAIDSLYSGYSLVLGYGAASGGGSSGFQTPISGSVDGTNATFVWTTAPNVLVVDQGRTMQKVSSDGTVNWTGTTTTVLTISPTFDVFGIA